MNRSKYVGLLGLLIAVLMTNPMLGQASADISGNTSVSTTAPSSVSSDSESGKGEGETQVRYIPSLSGASLIALGDNIPSHIFGGATTTAGWDSNPNNTSRSDTGAASKFFTLNPYIEFVSNTPHTKSVAQYRSTNTSYGSQYAWQNMNLASANVVVDVSQRLSWDMNAMGSYGRDSARFLGSDQTVAVGGTAGTGPNSATYLQNAGIVAHGDANIGVRYKSSERDAIEVRAGESYSNYSGLNITNRISTIGMTYSRNISDTFGMFTYLRESYYHGYIHCSSYGVGAGLRWRPSEKTQIDISGGPQLNTSECGSRQGLSYAVSFSKRLTGNSQFYLLSARAPNTADIGLGVWQESVSGGYQRQVSSRAEAIFNVSFVANDTVATIPSFHGTYFDCRYQVDFGHGLQGVYSYRGYFSASDGNSLSRNVATFGLNWAPKANRSLR